MKEKNDKKIKKEFSVRQTRQIIAIAASLFFVLLCAVIYRRPDRFGPFSKDTLVAVQMVLVAAFFGFSAVNWRCPSCKKFIGNDIGRPACRKCGARFR